MNIFILDYDFEKNAQYLCNRHIVKLPLEQAQMLCSVYYYTDFIPNNIYKPTQPNNACMKWARESLSNWLWLAASTIEMCIEYTYRYNKKHACLEIVENLTIPHIKDIGLTPFVQIMPNRYKNINVVTAYRNYYLGEKQHLFKWKYREIPYWIKEKERF